MLKNKSVRRCYKVVTGHQKGVLPVAPEPQDVPTLMNLMEQVVDSGVQALAEFAAVVAATVAPEEAPSPQSRRDLPVSDDDDDMSYIQPKSTYSPPESSLSILAYLRSSFWNSEDTVMTDSDEIDSEVAWINRSTKQVSHALV